MCTLRWLCQVFRQTVLSVLLGWYNQSAPRLRKAIKTGQVHLGYGLVVCTTRWTATLIHLTKWWRCITILCSRRTLGWNFRGSAYCHLFREARKRLKSAQPPLHNNVHMNGWQKTVRLQTSDIAAVGRRMYCLKSWYKHPVKVYVWDGISWNVPTDMALNGILYTLIIQEHTAPKLQDLNGHKFTKDNDSKHTFTARTFFKNNGILPDVKHPWKSRCQLTPLKTCGMNSMSDTLWHNY